MIVGFNFTKISAVRQAPVKGNMKISNRVSLTNVESADLAFGKEKQKVVRFSFQYVSDYEPGIGKVELEGDLIYAVPEADVKSVIAKWKKEKKVEATTMAPIINHILMRCNIQGLIVGQEVNLPPQLQLPKVQVKDKA